MQNKLLKSNFINHKSFEVLRQGVFCNLTAFTNCAIYSIDTRNTVAISIFTKNIAFQLIDFIVKLLAVKNTQKYKILPEFFFLNIGLCKHSTHDTLFVRLLD